MIVIDTSVFIDALFEYNTKRCDNAKKLFRIAQNKELKVIEPEIFKVELIGQLVRRMEKSEALLLYEEIVEKVEVIGLESLKEMSFSVAFETGCRAIDSYFIASAKLTDSILITNDRIMAENARKSGANAYYLIEDFERIVENLERMQQ